MGLANSLITTAIITGLVWAVAIYQPSANAIESKSSNLVLEQAAEKPPKQQTSIKVIKPIAVSSSKQQSEKTKALNNTPEVIQISGISMRLSLDNTAPLWQAFEQATELHNQLSKQPKQLYVSYGNFDNDFDTATVTIGYNAALLNSASKLLTVSLSQYKTLLVRSNYRNDELKTGWQKINYNAALDSVLEIHQLDGQGQSVATELLVAYR
ncbi:hypothetical protein [Thalassotalea montiporae]